MALSAFQIKLERLEKLCRALQTERNELNEKVEVLKEQVSGRAAGGGPVPPEQKGVLVVRKPVQRAGDPGWGLSPGPPWLCGGRGAWGSVVNLLPREADRLHPPCLR